MCFEAVGMIMLRKVTSNAGMEVMVVASSVDDPELVPKLCAPFAARVRLCYRDLVMEATNSEGGVDRMSAIGVDGPHTYRSFATKVLRT